MSYFHPQRMPVLPARRRKAARLQLEEMVRLSAQAPRRRPPVAVAAAIVFVLLGTGAGTFAVVAHQAVTDRHLARCFTVADESGFYTSVAVPGKPGSVGQVNNARFVCAALYREGTLKLGAHRVIARPANGKYPVPRLVSCTWQDGTAAVFPGRPGTCEKIGLPAAARR